MMKANHVIVANFYVTNMSFNTIRENEILAKISEFIVLVRIQTGTSPLNLYNYIIIILSMKKNHLIKLYPL